MAMLMMLILAALLMVAVAALFSAASDPARVDKEEAKRVGNPPYA